jgi:hypothetical protein
MTKFAHRSVPREIESLKAFAGSVVDVRRVLVDRTDPKVTTITGHETGSALHREVLLKTAHKAKDAEVIVVVEAPVMGQTGPVMMITVREMVLALHREVVMRVDLEVGDDMAMIMDPDRKDVDSPAAGTAGRQWGHPIRRKWSIMRSVSMRMMMASWTEKS